MASRRKSAVILAFSAGAEALLGLVVAWFAACEGSRHRDGTPPFDGMVKAPTLTSRRGGRYACRTASRPSRWSPADAK
jgi:hypothetical protein